MLPDNTAKHTKTPICFALLLLFPVLHSTTEKHLIPQFAF